MKVNITIPNSLDEITLGQFQEFSKRSLTLKTDSELNLLILEVFCGLKLEDTMSIKASDASAISDIILEMLNHKPYKVTSFKMYGEEFAIIPDLDEISLGEYVDLDKYINEYDTMHLAMGVMYRPIAKKLNELYNLEDYEPLKYDMKNMPMSAANYALVFFYNLGIDLLKTTNNYSLAEERALAQKLGLTLNGGGSAQFMHSLSEILQNLNISLN